MKKEYIEREALIKTLAKVPVVEWNHKAAPISWAYAYEQFISDVETFPTADVVSRGCVNQIQFERDLAIEQLNSYGVSLGEKTECAKVVHGEWEYIGKDKNGHVYRCTNCTGRIGLDYETEYCPNCGAKMDGGKENA